MGDAQDPGVHQSAAFDSPPEPGVTESTARVSHANSPEKVPEEEPTPRAMIAEKSQSGDGDPTRDTPEPDSQQGIFLESDVENTPPQRKSALRKRPAAQTSSSSKVLKRPAAAPEAAAEAAEAVETSPASKVLKRPAAAPEAAEAVEAGPAAKIWCPKADYSYTDTSGQWKACSVHKKCDSYTFKKTFDVLEQLFFK